jgi:hypothetical protein
MTVILIREPKMENVVKIPRGREQSAESVDGLRPAPRTGTAL